MARQMKDSGIEWIGEIPADWELGRIGQLYSERREKVSDRDFEPLSVTMQGIVPQLSTAAKTDAHDDRKLVKKGDFAINSRSDRRGSCGVSPYDGSVSLINTILAPHDDMNAGYYNWLFHTTMFADEYYKWGHGIVNDLWTTGWQDMKRISIPIPCIEEQERIAEYLDQQCAHIDAVIEKTKASIEEYKKLKQAVITEAVTKGVRGERPMKESNIERVEAIPDDWASMKMKYFMYIRARLGWKGLKADEYVDDGYTFIGTPNIDDNGSIDWENVYYITKERYEESPEIMLSEGDVLLTKDGAGIGKCAYIDFLPNEAAPNGSLAVITCNEIMHGKYLFYYFKSYYFQKYIDQIKAGMGVPHLFQGDLREIAIPVPNMDEQKEIIEYLDCKCKGIDELIKKKEQTLIEMDIYKKSIIYEYVTGKKEV